MKAAYALLATLSPVIVVAAIVQGGPAGIVAALVLAAALLLLGRGRGRMARLLPLAIAALALLSLASDSSLPLRYYPLAVNSGFAVAFGLSLVYPPSAIERIARLQDPDLPPAGVRYTRRVTQVWLAFFVLNGTVSLWTAVWGSVTQWALYNGLIAYLLIGTLFAAEWLVRQRVLRNGEPRG